MLAPATMERLLRYGWPGNVRELKNAMDHAAAIVTEVVGPRRCPPPCCRPRRRVPRRSRAGDARGTAARLAGSAGARHPAPRCRRQAGAIEEALVSEALALADGNKSAAARLLGVHRKVVERRLARERGLPRENYRPAARGVRNFYVGAEFAGRGPAVSC